jgi:hypothetical protein
LRSSSRRQPRNRHRPGRAIFLSADPATFISCVRYLPVSREIGIHVASDLLDLDNGILHRLLSAEKFLHPAQG